RVGTRVQAAAPNAGAVQALRRPQSTAVRRCHHPVRVIGERGDDAYLVSGANPGPRKLMDAGGRRGRLRHEVVRHIANVHRGYQRCTGKPLRIDSTAAKVTRVTCADPSGSTADGWPLRTA